MARLQKGVNDLKTWCLDNGDFGKQLISEWTGKCEDGSYYKIDEVSFGSNKKFKWKCSKGHEWYATVSSRTARKSGCPDCHNANRGEIASKAKLSNENNLKTWCLNNGSFGEQLIKEWTGECEDEKHYRINAVTRGSNKRFKWYCQAGHEWLASVIDRTKDKTGCPYCFRNSQSEINAKAKLSEKNSLKTWCMSNGSFGQQLKSEWTGLCEDGKHYKIDEVSYGSSKKFKWVCFKDHEWFATVNNRTKAKCCCPYCSGTRVSNENSLETWCMNNDSFGEQLIKEWTGECEDGEHYNMDQVSFGSNKKFKWRCSKGHEWIADVVGRTARKSGCTYCSAWGTSYPEQFIYHSLKQIYPSAENRCKVLKSTQNPQGVEFDIGVPYIPLCIEYSSTYWHEGREERDQYKKDLCEQCGVRLIQIVEDSYNKLEHTTSDDYICFKMNENKKDEILIKIVDHILKTLGHSISEIDLELVKQKAYESSNGTSNQVEDAAIKA